MPDGAALAAASMRIAIVGLPNAGKSTLFNALTRRRCGDRRLPVHDDRAQRRGRRRPRPAARPGRRDGRQLRAGPGDDLLPRHRRPGQGGLGGGGPRQPVPRLDPRDRRDLPRRPLPRARAACPTPTAASTRSATPRRSRPSCCSPTTSRPSAGSSGSSSRPAPGAEAIAERDWLEAVREALGAGRPARRFPVPEAAPESARLLGALTSKPVLYVANVDEGEVEVPRGPGRACGAGRGGRRSRSAPGSRASWPSSSRRRPRRCASSSGSRAPAWSGWSAPPTSCST